MNSPFGNLKISSHDFQLHQTMRIAYNIDMEKHRKIWTTILSIIGVVCLIAACVLIIGQAHQNRQSEERLEAMRDSAEAAKEETLSPSSTETTSENPETDDTIETTLESSTASDSEEGSEEESDTGNVSAPTETESTSETANESPEADNESPAVPNPYADVFASYEDIAAWLVVPGTIIDYPVVWTPEDENYYLYRDIDGNEDKNGSLILDTDSSVDPVSTNLIIHGHNMRSGAMFGNLTDYESQDFYEDHKQITLYTEECQRNYEVIAVFRSQVYKKKDTVFKYYKFFQADTQEEFEDFYQNIKNLSLYDTGVTAEFGDRFITLSTCVYHVEQGRFVVVAKEVESGDTYLPVQE